MEKFNQNTGPGINLNERVEEIRRKWDDAASRMIRLTGLISELKGSSASFDQQEIEKNERYFEEARKELFNLQAEFDSIESLKHQVLSKTFGSVPDKSKYQS